MPPRAPPERRNAINVEFSPKEYALGHIFTHCAPRPATSAGPKTTADMPSPQRPDALSARSAEITPAEHSSSSAVVSRDDCPSSMSTTPAPGGAPQAACPHTEPAASATVLQRADSIGALHADADPLSSHLRAAPNTLAVKCSEKEASGPQQHGALAEGGTAASSNPFVASTTTKAYADGSGIAPYDVPRGARGAPTGNPDFAGDADASTSYSAERAL
ncbi:hypothetical protein FA95DRAFT_1675494 [Auriscalpium vulgare]|uniref:Uncharacterized protein n=1 Tax=Auriscalpium vulgare TaxID=40419 RepID=A0ACB8S6S1_9AGAM|nr:hypothetical protein FA95DRAFT_1675494 [Auriscalpium vulgare]